LNFANNFNPKANDTIVYIQGSWDILHHGHLKRLEEAKKLGDFLYVGIWDDEMTRYYRGKQYPIVSIQERVLMCLACKHVDDVVIGAPFILTDDLIKSLNIKKVISVKNTKEDCTLKQHQEIDQFAVARKQGILHEISIDDDFF
jgi:ethanolamine-phosphate cytidylyltransferase